METRHLQCSDQHEGAVPDLESYIEMQRVGSWCAPLFALIEYAHGLELPEDVLQHETMQELVQAAKDFIVWLTVSVTSHTIALGQLTELQDILICIGCGENCSTAATHNLVALLMRENGLGLQDAVNHAGDLCSARLEDFKTIKSGLPSWGPKVDAAVSAYVQGLEDCMTGVQHWSFETERYFGTLASNVRMLGVIAMPSVEL